MNLEKLIKETKIYIWCGIAAGLVLLATALVLWLLHAGLAKVFFSLSFIPFSFSLIYVFKLSRLKKHPGKIKPLIVDETDERLVAIKNEVNAKALKLTQGIGFLAYTGYTLAVPADIFVSPGWWIVLLLLFFSLAAQAVLAYTMAGRGRHEEEL